jgi:hypothetical protein
MTEKLPRGDFSELKEQWRLDWDVIMRSIPDFDSVLLKINRDIEFKTLGLRNMVDESTTSVFMSVENCLTDARPSRRSTSA